MLKASLSICKKYPNQWSIDEWIEALAGALIHQYLINDGHSVHPALSLLRQERATIPSLYQAIKSNYKRPVPNNQEAMANVLDQVLESDHSHQSLKTLLAVQMLLWLTDFFRLSLDLSKYREHLTGIVDHNINQLNDWIASISREKLIFFGVNPQARSLIDWSKIQIMPLLSICAI